MHQGHGLNYFPMPISLTTKKRCTVVQVMRPYSGGKLINKVQKAGKVSNCRTKGRSEPLLSKPRTQSAPRSWGTHPFPPLPREKTWLGHFSARPTTAPRNSGKENVVGTKIIWGTSPPHILQIYSLHQVATGPPRLPMFHFGTVE